MNNFFPIKNRDRLLRFTLPGPSIGHELTACAQHTSKRKWDFGSANLGLGINIENRDNTIVISNTKRLTIDTDNARIF